MPADTYHTTAVAQTGCIGRSPRSSRLTSCNIRPEEGNHDKITVTCIAAQERAVNCCEADDNQKSSIDGSLTKDVNEQCHLGAGRMLCRVSCYMVRQYVLDISMQK